MSQPEVGRAVNEVDSSLELFVRQKLQSNPGCLDGKLLHIYSGEAYVQALHGDNPLAAGFSIPASTFRNVDTDPSNHHACSSEGCKTHLVLALLMLIGALGMSVFAGEYMLEMWL